MMTMHDYEITHERTRHDGVIVDSVDIRILYAYHPEQGGDGDIRITGIEERSGVRHPRWVAAQPVVRDWAEAWAIDNDDVLIEAARNDITHVETDHVRA